MPSKLIITRWITSGAKAERQMMSKKVLIPSTFTLESPVTVVALNAELWIGNIAYVFRQFAGPIKASATMLTIEAIRIRTRGIYIIKGVL